MFALERFSLTQNGLTQQRTQYALRQRGDKRIRIPIPRRKSKRRRRIDTHIRLRSLKIETFLDRKGKTYPRRGQRSQFNFRAQYHRRYRAAALDFRQFTNAPVLAEQRFQRLRAGKIFCVRFHANFLLGQYIDGRYAASSIGQRKTASARIAAFAEHGTHAGGNVNLSCALSRILDFDIPNFGIGNIGNEHFLANVQAVCDANIFRKILAVKAKCFAAHTERQSRRTPKSARFGKCDKLRRNTIQRIVFLRNFAVPRIIEESITAAVRANLRTHTELVCQTVFRAAGSSESVADYLPVLRNRHRIALDFRQRVFQNAARLFASL